MAAVYFSFDSRGNSSTGKIKSCLISHPVEELQMHLFIRCASSVPGQGRRGPGGGADGNGEENFSAQACS